MRRAFTRFPLIVGSAVFALAWCPSCGNMSFSLDSPGDRQTRDLAAVSSAESIEIARPFGRGLAGLEDAIGDVIAQSFAKALPEKNVHYARRTIEQICRDAEVQIYVFVCAGLVLPDKKKHEAVDAPRLILYVQRAEREDLKPPRLILTSPISLRTPGPQTIPERRGWYDHQVWALAGAWPGYSELSWPTVYEEPQEDGSSIPALKYPGLLEWFEDYADSTATELARQLRDR